MNVAVIGSKGYVGSEIVKFLSKNKEICVTEITRLEFDSREIQTANYDFVIHSANPARRYLAEQNPVQDYAETVIKTEFILDKFNFSKLILISTFSSRTQPTTSYGGHRLQCEELVLAKKGSVVRLGPMYGGFRQKTTLDEIVAGLPIYFSKQTKYSYVDVAWNANYISNNLSKFEGTTEIGARNYITLEEIASKLNSDSVFGDVDDSQVTDNFEDGPDAHDVLNFLAQKV